MAQQQDQFIQAVIDFEVAYDEFNAGAFRNSDPSIHTGPWTGRSIRAFREMEALKATKNRAASRVGQELNALYGTVSEPDADESWLGVAKWMATFTHVETREASEPGVGDFIIRGAFKVTREERDAEGELTGYWMASPYGGSLHLFND